MLICEQFAKFIAQTRYEDLPEEVISTAKERILDTVGATIAGHSNWDYASQLLFACRGLGAGKYKAVGSDKGQYPAARVAMINSAYAHSIELDDGHKNAGCHAGAVVVPTALAMAQELGCSGKALILAVVLGYEVVYRIAVGVNPAQINRGFHPSSNCGIFGATAVVGKLLGLSEKQLSNALGQAGMLASGTMEATVSGQLTKCIQVGNAAYNGFLAAYLAQTDMEGCVTTFEGKNGLFATQSEKVDIENICKDLGNRYLIADTYNKMYPTCRHSQPGIEAVLDLSKAYRLLPEEVAHIDIGTHWVAYDLTGIIKAPTDSGEAKFSLAYGAAIAMKEHAFGVGHLTPAYYTDQGILALADKVDCRIDAEVQSVFPKKRGAKVKITLKNGAVYEKELYDLKGSPNNPVGWKELEEKYIANAMGVYSKARITEQIEAIQHLEQVANAAILSDLLS